MAHQPFIWETVNYLSSQGSDANLTVGTRVQIDVDAARFKANENLKLERFFYKADQGKPVMLTRAVPEQVAAYDLLAGQVRANLSPPQPG